MCKIVHVIRERLGNGILLDGYFQWHTRSGPILTMGQTYSPFYFREAVKIMSKSGLESGE